MATGFSGFPQRGDRILSLAGASQSARVVSTAQRHLRRTGKAAHAHAGGGRKPRPGRLCAGLRHRAPRRPSTASTATRASARTRRPTRTTSPPASIATRGVAHGDAGYYFAVSHKEVAVGGGIYMPEPQTLLALRHHIAARHEELRQILAHRALRRLFGDLQGEQLSRVPKGFCRDHPAADLLRYKRFILYVELPPDLATTRALYTRDRQALPRHGPVPDLSDGAARPRAPQESTPGICCRFGLLLHRGATEKTEISAEVPCTWSCTVESTAKSLFSRFSAVGIAALREEQFSLRLAAPGQSGEHLAVGAVDIEELLRRPGKVSGIDFRHQARREAGQGKRPTPQVEAQRNQRVPLSFRQTARGSLWAGWPPLRPHPPPTTPRPVAE